MAPVVSSSQGVPMAAMTRDRLPPTSGPVAWPGRIVRTGYCGRSGCASSGMGRPPRGAGANTARRRASRVKALNALWPGICPWKVTRPARRRMARCRRVMSLKPRKTFGCARMTS